MSEVPEPDPDPAYRRNVGIMLLDAEGRVWVGKRIGMAEGGWQMPQGGIDAGEEPQAAAVRELHEEIGTDKAQILFATEGWLLYDVPADLAKERRWHGKWRGQAQRWYAMRFTGTDKDIDIATEHPEFDEWRWARRDELVGLIVPFKRKVYEAVVAEFEPKLRGMGM
ncbi:MAG TPA: RNA pyrophosphohydrolase [Aliidongia sp.]|nr:RNA pyrophosphohydrolase [Aliidongia sp.]